MSAASYIYYGDNNVEYTDAVVDAFEKNKVTYKNSVMGQRSVAIVFIKTPRVKKILDGLAPLYTGKMNP